MPMDVYTDPSVITITGGVSITKDIKDGTAGNLTVAGTTTQSGVVTAATGISVTAGGITVTAGGVSITAGTLTSGGSLVAATGISVTAGGINVTGGATIDQLFGGLGASAVAVASSATIATNVRVSRISPTAAVTAMVLGTGTVNGQTVVVSNENATGSITATFAASSTSNVLGGTGVVISGAISRLFVWNGSLWN